MKSNRIEWIDTLKILGIFYIYLGHFGKSAGSLYPFVFSFHVPLFFFISGLFASSPNSIGALLKVTKKTFSAIIIPYFIFCVISIMFYCIRFQWGPDIFYEKVVGALTGVRGVVFAESLWFLPCLFVVIIYHATLSLIFKRKAFVLAISLVIYVWLMPKAIISHPYYFFNVDSGLCYLAYYSLGGVLSSTLQFNSFKEKSMKFKAIFISLLLLSLILFINSYFYGYEIFFKKIESSHIRVLVAFFVTSLLFIPSIAIAYLINSKTLSSMGRSTIVFCGTEQILKLAVFSSISLFGFKLSFTNPAQTVIISVLCLALSNITIVKAYNYYMKK